MQTVKNDTSVSVTRRVASQILVFRLLLLTGAVGLALVAIGCSSGRDRTQSNLLGGTTYPFNAGERCAVVLTQDTCSAGASGTNSGRYPGEGAGGGTPISSVPGAGVPQLPPGATSPASVPSQSRLSARSGYQSRMDTAAIQSGVPGSTGISGTPSFPGMGDQNLVGSYVGQRGQVSLLSVSENPLPFANYDRSYAATLGGQFETGRAKGQLVSTGVAIDGLSTVQNMRSQVAFSSDGSVIYVTETFRDQVRMFGRPTGSCSTLIPYEPIRVGSKPTEIAVGATPWGDVALILNGGGFSVIRTRTVDLLYGTGIPQPSRFDPFHDRFGGHATAAAWLPPDPDTGLTRWFLLASNVGRVDLCNIGYIMDWDEMPQQSWVSSSFTRGCFPGDPALIDHVITRGTVEGYQLSGVGSQRINGQAIKLAANEHVVSFLDSTSGPSMLLAPGTGTVAPILGYRGPLERSGCFNCRFTDFAIQPFSDDIIALVNNRVKVYSTDSDAAVLAQRFDDGFPLPNNGKPVAIAMDPGPDPKFVLIADETPDPVTQQYGLWVSELDGRSLFPPNPPTDRAILGKCQSPTDAAIAPRLLRQVTATTAPAQ
ncbi:MAG TPA: hypothetical protein VI895_15040 [Bdellovibrionota bacterium]|nr:hypothetical protein [Bdellovibrionota bacterium]